MDSNHGSLSVAPWRVLFLAGRHKRKRRRDQSSEGERRSEEMAPAASARLSIPPAASHRAVMASRAASASAPEPAGRGRQRRAEGWRGRGETGPESQRTSASLSLSLRAACLMSDGWTHPGRPRSLLSGPREGVSPSPLARPRPPTQPAAHPNMFKGKRERDGKGK